MAKVKGPAFSLGARGAIGKTLIYNVWKGIDYVKEYVIPANPKTEDQKKQRGYFEDAVDAWHVDGYTAADVAAWNLYALSQKIAASGFNMFVRFYIKAKVAVKAWTKITNVEIADILTTTATVTADIASDQTGILYVGVTKTAMFKEFTGVFGVSEYTFSLIDLVKDTTYYFYIKNTAVDEVARTGVYSFKTAAA